TGVRMIPPDKLFVRVLLVLDLVDVLPRLMSKRYVSSSLTRPFAGDRCLHPRAALPFRADEHAAAYLLHAPAAMPKNAPKRFAANFYLGSSRSVALAHLLILGNAPGRTPRSAAPVRALRPPQRRRRLPASRSAPSRSHEPASRLRSSAYRPTVRI